MSAARPLSFRQPSSRRSSFSSIASTSSWALEATADADDRSNIAPRLYRNASSSSSISVGKDKDSLRLRIALDLARSGYEIDSPLGSPGFDPIDRTPRRGFIAPAPRVRQLSGESSSMRSKRANPPLLDLHKITTSSSLSPPPPPESSFLDLSKTDSPVPKAESIPARQRALEDVAAGALRALQMREVEPDAAEETQNGGSSGEEAKTPSS